MEYFYNLLVVEHKCSVNIVDTFVNIYASFMLFEPSFFN